MIGQWWESDLIVGPFANMAEANAWAAANPSSLFLGLLATSNGQQISWRGAGVGWLPMGVDTSLTLAQLLAKTGSTGDTAKCIDPMFGPMGAIFDWAQSLGKWVPRNARIYGAGVGTVYTASAGDINTDVQVGSLTIPGTLLYPGIDVMCVSVGERSSGVGSVQHKILCGAAPIGAAQVGYALTQSGRLLASGGVGINGNLTQKGPFNGNASGGGGGGTSYVWAGAGASCLVKASLNAPTAGMVQTLTELYAELSYGG